MNNSFGSLVESAKEILILLPTKPSFDEVSAGLALYLSLLGQKTTFVSSPSPMTVEFNRLVGVNKIKSELGGRNLTVKLVGYSSKNIEKVSYDIVNDEFCLVIVPKEGQAAPGSDQIQLSYAGVSADTIILVGGKNDKDFPALSLNELEKSKVIHVGISSFEAPAGREVLSLAKPSSSISELVFSLINESGVVVDGDMASNLFAGIQNATKHLMTPEVSADTYETIAKLLRSGARRDILIDEAPTSNFPFATMVTGDTEKAKNKSESATPKDWFEPKIFTGNASGDANKLG